MDVLTVLVIEKYIFYQQIFLSISISVTEKYFLLSKNRKIFIVIENYFLLSIIIILLTLYQICLSILRAQQIVLSINIFIIDKYFYYLYIFLLSINIFIIYKYFYYRKIFFIIEKYFFIIDKYFFIIEKYFLLSIIIILCTLFYICLSILRVPYFRCHLSTL